MAFPAKSRPKHNVSQIIHAKGGYATEYLGTIGSPALPGLCLKLQDEIPDGHANSDDEDNEATNPENRSGHIQQNLEQKPQESDPGEDQYNGHWVRHESTPDSSNDTF